MDYITDHAPYEVPFHTHSKALKSVMPVRHGVFLKGKTHIAEVAPPPSQQVILEQLHTIDWKHPPRLPCIDFAVNALSTPLETPFSVNVNGLIDAPQEMLFNQLKEINACGYQTLKVKVDHLSWEDARDYVAMILTLYSGSVRIDIKRAWSASDALNFSNSFPKGAFEYLEDPANSWEELTYFAKNSKHPIALDEFLRTNLPKDWFLLPKLHALVLKPSCLGGAIDSLLFVAKERDFRPIFSHAYESDVGLAHIANLAYIHAPKETHGLAPHNALKDLEIEKPLYVSGGKLMVDQLPTPLCYAPATAH